MRRLILAVLTALALVIGPISLAEPADAHPIPPGTPGVFAWCEWIRATTPTTASNYHLANARFIHYGDAHVYQCHFRSNAFGPQHNLCSQTVEWYGFGPTDFYNGDPLFTDGPPVDTPCW